MNDFNCSCGLPNNFCVLGSSLYSKCVLTSKFCWVREVTFRAMCYLVLCHLNAQFLCMVFCIVLSNPVTSR